MYFVTRILIYYNHSIGQNITSIMSYYFHLQRMFLLLLICCLFIIFLEPPILTSLNRFVSASKLKKETEIIKSVLEPLKMPANYTHSYAESTNENNFKFNSKSMNPLFMNPLFKNDSLTHLKRPIHDINNSLIHLIREIGVDVKLLKLDNIKYFNKNSVSLKKLTNHIFSLINDELTYPTSITPSINAQLTFSKSITLLINDQHTHPTFNTPSINDQLTYPTSINHSINDQLTYPTSINHSINDQLTYRTSINHSINDQPTYSTSITPSIDDFITQSDEILPSIYYSLNLIRSPINNSNGLSKISYSIINKNSINQYNYTGSLSNGPEIRGMKKRLPHAIIIGVKKGGTRALLEFLKIHPDIRTAGPETHFFDKNYDRGLEWYRNIMPPTDENQLTMEKTPGYFVTEQAPERIKLTLPNVKLIIVVRNPVTRVISDYAQLLSKKPDLESFVKLAFRNTIRNIDSKKNTGFNTTSYSDPNKRGLPDLKKAFSYETITSKQNSTYVTSIKINNRKTFDKVQRILKESNYNNLNKSNDFTFYETEKYLNNLNLKNKLDTTDSVYFRNISRILVPHYRLTNSENSSTSLIFNNNNNKNNNNNDETFKNINHNRKVLIDSVPLKSNKKIDKNLTFRNNQNLKKVSTFQFIGNLNNNLSSYPFEDNLHNTISSHSHPKNFNVSKTLRENRNLYSTSDLLDSVNENWSPIEVGKYSKHLKRWLRYFPLNRIHIVDGEKLISDPVSELKKVEIFLKVKSFIDKRNFIYNTSKGFPCLVRRNYPNNTNMNTSNVRKNVTVFPHIKNISLKVHNKISTLLPLHYSTAMLFSVLKFNQSVPTVRTGVTKNFGKVLPYTMDILKNIKIVSNNNNNYRSEIDHLQNIENYINYYDTISTKNVYNNYNNKSFEMGYTINSKMNSLDNLAYHTDGVSNNTSKTESNTESFSNITIHCLNKNKGRAHPNLNKEILEKLSKLYQPYNLEFYKLTGINFNWS